MSNDWTVKEVMDYYGRWIENEVVAKDMMEEVKRRIPQLYKLSFSAKMNQLRELLIYEYGHKDIPFISMYRRSK